MSLWPRAGWCDPELRTALSGGLANVGYMGLYQWAFVLVITNAAGVPGGAIEFQSAHN